MIDAKHFRFLAWRWFQVGAINALRLDVRRRLALLALLAIAAIGCAPEPTTMHGDVTFTAAERVAVERAAAFMAERTGRPALAIVWDAPHAESGCERETIVRREGAIAYQGRGFDGRMIAERACIMINASVDAGRFQAIAAHEVGHWHGLGHHDELGIMNRSVAGAMVWTDADERVCQRADDGECRYQGPEASE